MSELRKKAMTRLAICAVALVASIIFSVLLLTGTFDGKTDSGDAAPATSDTTSAAAGVNDPTADSFTAEATGDTAEPPAEEQPAEEQPAEPEPTPEPTPVPTFRGYQIHITFNDDAIVNTLNMIRDMMNHKAPYEDDLIDKALCVRLGKAFNKGIECILATQIIKDGEPSVWCQQIFDRKADL